MFYIFLADGFEEIEALVPLDLLRRAGVEVKTVGILRRNVYGSKLVPVSADILSKDVDLAGCSGVMLPGGMPGTEYLYESEFVQKAVRFCMEENRLLCCICAAPSVPGRMGLLKGRKAVCFPGFEEKLLGATVADAPVVQDGNLITAKGAGCVFPFAHKIISALADRETADCVISQIQYSDM